LLIGKKSEIKGFKIKLKIIIKHIQENPTEIGKPIKT
jgi:hypothetical protein